MFLLCVRAWEWQALILCVGVCACKEVFLCVLTSAWESDCVCIQYACVCVCVHFKPYSQQEANQADPDYFIFYNFSFILPPSFLFSLSQAAVTHFCSLILLILIFSLFDCLCAFLPIAPFTSDFLFRTIRRFLIVETKDTAHFCVTIIHRKLLTINKRLDLRCVLLSVVLFKALCASTNLEKV